jgi:hypothetical protein
LRLIPLGDLFVFGQLPQLVWSSIFDACDDWLTECRKYPAPPPPPAAAPGLPGTPGPGSLEQARQLYLPKTLRRLEDFARATDFPIDRELVLGDRPLPSLRGIAELAAQAIPAIEDRDLCVIHGDFCFSNILYDHRAGAVKLIDPRGGADLHGDPRYDVAKLHHSVIGLYDFLLAGRYWLEAPDARHFTLAFPIEAQHRDVQGVFAERVFSNTVRGSDPAILAVSVLLFLAMLPLHAESAARQRAFVANALRLFVEVHR